ncbi:MAG: tetratricopeptide repeat protein [Anaerolineaceae bacterium]
MANISLRDYYKEIDALISDGQFPIAVEHCKHILDTYPKDFEAYRLLGKAYLEDKDIVQAADIFERLLAIRPDDFVANIGMSCIREEEGNLDAAIWHMERAFELDSSTSTILSELKRLYTLRDGESPQKIRLTKGALVRMYVKGGMLLQAISEIQTKFPSLEERPDIQILLANLYCQTGQMDAAVDLCLKILQKLPYCFDANLILFNNYESSSGDSASSIYRDRIIETNSYYAFLQDFSLDVTSVPDDAVMLMKANPEILDKGETGNKMPAWFSEESQALQQPNSMNLEPQSPEIAVTIFPQDDLEVTRMEASKGPASEGETRAGFDTESSDVDLPDWMKESGWKPEVPQAELNVNESEPNSTGNILPADIPEWVQGMAPEMSGSSEDDTSNLADKTDLSEILFTNLENDFSSPDIGMDNNLSLNPEDGVLEGSAPAPVEETSSIPEWLQGFDPSQQKLEASDLNKSLPDWLGAEESAATTPQINPFTLEDKSTVQPDDSVEIQANEFPGTAPLSPESIADFEKPEWLKETQAEEEIKSLFASAEKQAQPDEELSSWLNNLRPDTTTSTTENTSQAADVIPDWLREPEPEPQAGDTEPFVLKSQPDQENLDFWIPEHAESESTPEFPVSGSSEVSNVSGFFDELAGQEKTMTESAPDTQENLKVAFSAPELSVVEGFPIDSVIPPKKDNIISLMDYYNQQLQSGQDLPVIIDEVKKLTGEFPGEPGIWLVLGDAYHHNKQIQAALDAYSRAEEFLSK